MDWTQTGVELTITDDGEDYVYRVLLDGGLCTEQNGQTYWLGTDQLAFAFQRGGSGFIAAAEPRVERSELAWPEDEPDAWGTEPAGPLAVPEGRRSFFCPGRRAEKSPGMVEKPAGLCYNISCDSI